MNLPEVTVEFYGVPRVRAGCKEVCVSAQTALEALTAVAGRYPALADVCAADGRLAAPYLLSLDGERFISDLSIPMKQGDRLLLLSADAGG
jgi:molybdopterin converting factor small subunit